MEPVAPDRCALPSAEDAQQLLNGLFDRPVTVHQRSGPVLPGRGVHVVGTYQDDDGALRALLLCDLALGCALGAALSLVPAARVREARGSGAVPVALADDTAEVLNVAAALFPTANGFLRFRDCQVAPTPVSDDVVEFLRAAPKRVDLTVDVPGYGSGTLVVLLADA